MHGVNLSLLVLLQLAVIGFEHPRFYYGGEVSFKQLEPAGGRLRKVGGEWEWTWGRGGGHSTSQLSARSLPDHCEEASTGGVTRQGTCQGSEGPAAGLSYRSCLSVF